MKKKSLLEFLQTLLCMGVNAVFLAYFSDKKEMQLYELIEEYGDYKYKYTTYLLLSKAGSSLIIGSIFLIIMLKYYYKKLYAYLLLFASTLGCILIIIGMIIGCLYVFTYQEYLYFNKPLAFGFGQIALYLIACIRISQMMSRKKSIQQIPPQKKQSHQRIQQQTSQEIPIQQN